MHDVEADFWVVVAELQQTVAGDAQKLRICFAARRRGACALIHQEDFTESIIWLAGGDDHWGVIAVLRFHEDIHFTARHDVECVAGIVLVKDILAPTIADFFTDHQDQVEMNFVEIAEEIRLSQDTFALL